MINVLVNELLNNKEKYSDCNINCYFSLGFLFVICV